MIVCDLLPLMCHDNKLTLKNLLCCLRKKIIRRLYYNRKNSLLSFRSFIRLIISLFETLRYRDHQIARKFCYNSVVFKNRIKIFKKACLIY